MSDDDIRRIDDNIQRILTAVASLGDGQDRLRADLMARMDRLQDALTTQRDADVVNFGAAERAERLAKVAREDVTTMGEQINALVRQVRALTNRLDAIEDKH